MVSFQENRAIVNIETTNNQMNESNRLMGSIDSSSGGIFQIIRNYTKFHDNVKYTKHCNIP